MPLVAHHRRKHTIDFSDGFALPTDLTLNGNAAINGGKLRLTDGGATEASTAWFNGRVVVAAFVCDFTFQITSPDADGFTFCIQNQGLSALGGFGGELGYAADGGSGGSDITNSIAIKWDIFDNAGEGNNSTGLYTGGSDPKTPATTFGGGVDLHSSHVFSVHIVYDGTTLTWTTTDQSDVTKTYTTSSAIDIPTVIGASTAYAGFTGATGGLTATQDVLTWIFNNP